VRTIVVGYDACEAAKRALSKAADLAEAFGANLVVVLVAEQQAVVAEADPPPLEPGLTPVLPVPVPSPTVETPAALQVFDPLRENFEEAQVVLAGRRLNTEYVSKVGKPAELIAEVAELRNADLVVLGSHEQTLLGRLLGHDVTDEVLRHVHRDVLIVR
jgi:nucleotide-binding universal stress UspA family protein